MTRLRYLALAMVMLAIPALATNYYVSTSGLDSHTGLASSCADTAHAWLTIGKAVSTYAAGDTVNVCDGTYAENLTLLTSGTSGSRAVFQSVNKWGAKVTGSGTTAPAIQVRTSNYVDIVNFEVTNATGYMGIEMLA